jgi:molybdopterin converting factor subunit 1
MIKQESKSEAGELIRVRLLFFGAARDAAGHNEASLTLHGPMDAANAFQQVLAAYPALGRFGRSLLFAVNEEYAPRDRQVRDGDELAVFPPVSGGSEAETRSRRDAQPGSTGVSPALETTETDRSGYDFFELTTGRRTIYLVYEAYASMALSEMRRLGRQAHERFNIAHIGIVHRTGRLEITETSVVIAVSAPHRQAAFEACEWAIRELKRTVPIWKKEVFADGEIWVEGEGVPDEVAPNKSNQ